MARRSAERPVDRVQALERAVDILQVLSEDSRELAAGEVADRAWLSSIGTARRARPFRTAFLEEVKPCDCGYS